MDGDLINRAEALKAIEKLYVDGKFGVYNDSGEIFAKCHNAISNVPGVDAEPVRRAQWKAANRRGTLCDTYVCSECGNMVMQAEGYTYSCTCNYCPNCGANMDGETKDDG